MRRQSGRKRFDADALGLKLATAALIGRSARIGDDMTTPDYAEALRLIRKYMQPGDTLGMMFMRVAKALEATEKAGPPLEGKEFRDWWSRGLPRH